MITNTSIFKFCFCQLTNLPQTPPQLKEKTRKRKHAPEKLSQSSQTTAEAIASIQQHYQSARLTTQDQEQLIQQVQESSFVCLSVAYNL